MITSLTTPVVRMMIGAFGALLLTSVCVGTAAGPAQTADALPSLSMRLA